MAPFGISRPSWTKKKSKSGPEQVYLAEDPYGQTHAYTLSGGDHSQSQYMNTTTQVPTKTNRWKTVLKRKPAPQVVETLTPLRDHRYEEHSDEYYNHQGTLPPVPTNESPAHSYSQTVRQDQSVRRVDSRVDSGSSGSSRASSHRRAHSEQRGVARHETGRSGAVTILPHDSASNIHVYNEPQYQQTGHGGPLHGIVEEQSDISYNEPHVHRPISPVITPIGHPSPGQPMMIGPAGSVQRQETGGSYAVEHDIGRGLHLRHSEKHNGRGMMPFQVTDAHGNKQEIQEVMLDGSGIQEIPMPSHGNVIFIVEEGVTLDVKDPETGEYVPLEQYYADLAARRPPQQDQFVVVNGDASNVIVEDINGNVLHRGSKVKEEFISQRSRSHSERSEERHYERSQRSGSVRSGSNHHVTVGSGKTNHIKVTNPNPNPEIRVYHQQLASPAGSKQGMDHWVIDVPSEQQMHTPAVHVYSPHGSIRPPSQISRASSMNAPSAVHLQSAQGSMRPSLSRASSMNASHMAPTVNVYTPQGSMRPHMSRASSMNGPSASPHISRSVSVASGRYSTRSGVPAASIRSHEASTVEIVAEPGSNVVVTTGHEGEARLEHGMGSPVTVHVTGTPRSHQIDVASVRSMQPSVRSMARSTATREVVEEPVEEDRVMTPAQSLRMEPSPRSILKGRATPAKSIKSMRSLSKKTPVHESSVLGSRPPSQQSPVDDGASIHNALLMNPQPVEIMAMPVPHVEMAPITSPEKLHMTEEAAMESFKIPDAPSPGGHSVYMPPASPLGKPGSFRSGKSVRSNKSNLRRVGFESAEHPQQEGFVVERSPSVRSARHASAETLLSLVVPSSEPGSGHVAEEPMLVAQSPAPRSVRSARAPSIRAASYRENVLSAVDEGGESTLGFTGMPSPQRQGEVNLASPMKSPMQFSRPSSPYAHHETSQAFSLEPLEPVAPGGLDFDQWGSGSPGQKAPSIRSHQSHHSHNNQEQQLDSFGMLSSPGQRAPSIRSHHSPSHHEQENGWGVGSKAPSIRSHNSHNHNSHNEQFEEGGFGLGSPPKSRTPSMRAASIRSNKVLLSPTAADVVREAIGEEPAEEPTQMILEEPAGGEEPKESADLLNDLLSGDPAAEPTAVSADDWGFTAKEKKGKKGKKGKK